MNNAVAFYVLWRITQRLFERKDFDQADSDAIAILGELRRSIIFDDSTDIQQIDLLLSCQRWKETMSQLELAEVSQ